MIRNLLTLTVALSFVSSLAAAALSPSDKQSIPYENRAASVNSGFENGISKWVSSPAITLASATPQAGSKYAQWNSTSAAQTLTLGSIGRPEGQLEVSCAVRVPSGTATHTFSVVESSGSTTVASMSIENSTTWRYQTLIFPSPSAGTLSIVFTSVAADEPSIDIDDCYVGRARNVGSTQLVGKLPAYTPTTGGFGTNRSNLYVNMNRLGSRLTGDIALTATAAVSGTITFSLPSGVVIDTSTYRNGGSANVVGKCHARSSGSGADYRGDLIINDSTSFSVRGGDGSSNLWNATTPLTWANNDEFGCSLTGVEIQGWAASTVVMPDAQGWYVDASISGANPSLGTASVTSYTGIENGSLTMTQNTGSAGVQIGCSGTNAPSGLTCSSGNESLSVAFTPPKTGAYRACVTANHYIDSPAGSINVVSTFQIVETATNAQTIIQEGKGKAMSGSVSMSGDRREYRSVATCGDFVLSAGAQRMLRFMYETEISGTPDSHVIKADADSVLGQPDVHWTVYPLQDRATAILANSVSTGTANGDKIGRATIANSGSASITSQSTGFLSSVSYVSTGVVDTFFTAGYFSAAPSCTCTARLGGRLCAIENSAPPSTSGARFWTGAANTATEANVEFQIICVGPR